MTNRPGFDDCGEPGPPNSHNSSAKPARRAPAARRFAARRPRGSRDRGAGGGRHRRGALATRSKSVPLPRRRSVLGGDGAGRTPIWRTWPAARRPRLARPGSGGRQRHGRARRPLRPESLRLPSSRFGASWRRCRRAFFMASRLPLYITGATIVDGGHMVSTYGTWSEDTAEFRDGRGRHR